MEGGESIPESIARGAAVLHGNTAYLRPSNSPKMYILIPECSRGRNVVSGTRSCKQEFWPGSYQSSSHQRGWLWQGPTNIFLSLEGKGVEKHWSKVFPPMPTPRESAACISTEQSLVVAGGFAESNLDTVEVNTKQWTTVTSLPHNYQALSVETRAGGIIGHGLSKFHEKCTEGLFICSSLVAVLYSHTCMFELFLLLVQEWPRLQQPLLSLSPTVYQVSLELLASSYTIIQTADNYFLCVTTDTANSAVKWHVIEIIIHITLLSCN